MRACLVLCQFYDRQSELFCNWQLCPWDRFCQTKNVAVVKKLRQMFQRTVVRILRKVKVITMGI